VKTIAPGEARGTLYILVQHREEDWAQGGTTMSRSQAASRLGYVEKLGWSHVPPELLYWSQLDWRALITVS